MFTTDMYWTMWFCTEFIPGVIALVALYKLGYVHKFFNWLKEGLAD